MLRSSAVVFVVACALGGAPAALAQQGTTSYPEELWKAYPLEQHPTTQAPAPSPAAPRPATTASAADDGSGASLWWLVAAVAAGGAVALAAVGVRRHRAGAAEVHPRSTSEPDLAAAPAPSAAPPPEPAAPPPARAPRKADPVCQVRWDAVGGCFIVVATGPDGAERDVARSPTVDWKGSSPPEQEPELEVALKVLSKQLRDLGWRPLRARGFDYDERRWYARRFRWPTEAEAQTPATGRTPPVRVGMHANKGDA